MSEMDVAIARIDERSKDNAKSIDELKEHVGRIEEKQEVIHEIATSVQLIAEKMETVKERVDETNEKVKDTNDKINTQSEAWRETESKLTKKIDEIESKPYKRIEKNINSIKVAVITAICSMIATGIVSWIIATR